MTEPDAVPAPGAAAPPQCALCGAAAVVHWLRRLTPDEIAAEQAKEQARRDEATLLADPQQPAPVFGPLPDCLDYTRAVHGCMSHAITADAAAHIHQATCRAPSEGDLPHCNCTPEQPPQGDAGPGSDALLLPPGW